MYTLGQAARATGKSKPTIMRAIKGGRMSAGRNSDGTYVIDPAELHRVYPRNAQTQQSETGDVTAELRARIVEQAETIRDLRARLDASETERRAQLPGRLSPWRFFRRK